MYENASQPGIKSIGFAIKEPTLDINTDGLHTSGKLTASALRHAGSDSCCASGHFSWHILRWTPFCLAEFFALVGSPVILTSEDLTAPGLLFPGALISIRGMVYSCLPNGVFNNGTVTLDRPFEGENDSHPVLGDLAFVSSYTSTLSSNASAEDVDSALTA